MFSLFKSQSKQSWVKVPQRGFQENMHFPHKLPSSFLRQEMIGDKSTNLEIEKISSPRITLTLELNLLRTEDFVDG